MLSLALDGADQQGSHKPRHQQKRRQLHKARPGGDRNQSFKQIPNLIAVPIGVKDKRVVHHLNSLVLSGHASKVGAT